MFLLDSAALADTRLEMTSVELSGPSIVMILVGSGTIILYLIDMMFRSLLKILLCVLLECRLLENPFCLSGHKPNYLCFESI